MSDYNWSFPQRNETMFMATICSTFFIKKTASISKERSGSHPFKEQISPVHNPKGKSHSLYTKTTSLIPPTSSPFLKVTS